MRHVVVRDSDSPVLLADVWDDHHAFDRWWIVMMIGMILFWALVIVGIVLVVRYLSGPGGWQRTAPAGGREEQALEILDRRLAEGEISLEEYRERRAVLSGERSAQG